LVARDHRTRARGPGAVYPTLSQLEDEGLIDTVAQDGRKLATLTDAGQAYLHTHRETMPDPFAEFTARSSGGSDLRDALDELRHMDTLRDEFLGPSIIRQLVEGG
jgi:DNA-binding PadR family transcriptional regulator